MVGDHLSAQGVLGAQQTEGIDQRLAAALPVGGIMNVAPPSDRSMGRYKSSRREKRKRSAPPPMTGTTNKTKACSFCSGAGHNIGFCCPQINAWG